VLPADTEIELRDACNNAMQTTARLHNDDDRIVLQWTDADRKRAMHDGVRKGINGAASFEQNWIGKLREQVHR